METSTRTGEFEAASIEPASFQSTGEAIAADPAPPEFQPSMVAAVSNQCSVCAAVMASDQRYCVECGERRGAARVPIQDVAAQRAPATAGARRRPRRAAMSPNLTLIAGIGTLLLAMGIGVLIGRSGSNSSVKTPPAQIVTVAGAGAGTAASGAAAPTTSSAATPTSKSGTTHSTTKTTTTSKTSSKKSSAPQPKAAKVGSPGHGKGYQNGHFTGNFFGE